LLDSDARTSNSTLAKKLKTSDEVVHYRINRLIASKYVKKFYTIINVAKIGYYSFKLYLNYQNLNPEMEGKIIDYCKTHPLVFWVATSSGKWEFMIGVWVRNAVEFYQDFLEDFLNNFGKYVHERAITTTLNNRQWSRSWFVKDSIERTSSLVGGIPENIKLDSHDTLILENLANNARLPVAELAKQIGTTPAIVSGHLKNLMKNGIIQSFRISIDTSVFGYEFCKAFITLDNFTLEKKRMLIEWCKQQKSVLNVVECIGAWDIEIECEVEDFQKFYEIMKRIKEEFSDIVKSYDSVLMSKEPRVDFFPGCKPNLMTQNSG
ncbi:MAG: Lrp/AsnC family transcriptional regulator, partial [Candidatus Micrarchaeota archaeon]